MAKPSMLEKHLRRIKKSDSGNPEEDEWEETTSSIGERLPDQILEEVPDRSLIIEREKKDNLERYQEDAPIIKDQFTNVAQYAKLVKDHVADKESSFKKFKEQKRNFDKQVAQLRPKKIHPIDLGKLNYKEDKVRTLKRELEVLNTEREEIKQKIEHFNNKLKNAQNELNFKVQQIDDIEVELKRIEKKEILQNKIKTEEDALNTIKKELSYIGDVEQTSRIYGTVNSLVDLLKSKNKSTMNELASVKKEFKSLKEKYEKLMSELK